MNVCMYHVHVCMMYVLLFPFCTGTVRTCIGANGFGFGSPPSSAPQIATPTVVYGHDVFRQESDQLNGGREGTADIQPPASSTVIVRTIVTHRRLGTDQCHKHEQVFPSGRHAPHATSHLCFLFNV